MSDFTSQFPLPANLDDLAPWVKTHGLRAPYGMCQCRCGQLAPLANKTDSRRGWREGWPIRFISGHNVERSIVERFWEKVNKIEIDDCWLWEGSVNSRGYGVIGMRKLDFLAHRVSWEIHFGRIENGLFVCHHCDMPLCVNPTHLWLGTHKDNMQDMIAKGRGHWQKRNVL